MENLVGQIIDNRYEIIEKLGGGGMALVYKGFDLLLSRTVTIKILREQLASDGDVVRRFQKEAQAVAKLSHPNIVSIYDVGQENGLYYLIMEYIDGKNLKEVILEKGKLEIGEAINFAMQICDALQHAHDNNVIHRDIKPQNILITNKGRLKVTDFGIAQAVTNATLTYSGSGIIGTVQYISPEQARGEISSIHTDLYSAGIVLYEMLTGRLPFEGDTAIGIAMKHIQEDYPPVSNYILDFPPELEQIIERCLRKDPEKRFSSAFELKYALGEVNIELSGKLSDTQVLPRVSKKRTAKRKDSPKKPVGKLKPAGIILLVLAIIGLPLLVYSGIQKYLTVSEVVVPSVTGLPLAEAELSLFKVGLQWEEGKRRHDTEIPANHVLFQNPKADEKVKKTRVVTLDISLGQEVSKVPDLIGKEERQARVELANSGFTAVEQAVKKHDPKMPEGHIIDQHPKPNNDAVLGTEVQLIVSLGPEPSYITMPDLLGKNLQEVKKIFSENNLTSGDVSHEVSYEYFSGQVIKQGIPVGEKVLQKTPVDIVLSLGPGPTPKSATVQLKVQAGKDQRLIRVVISDSTGEHEEYSGMHDANDFISIEVPYFGQGQAKIYDDDVLIDETSLL
ncbi:MAG: Stk1 family PASTA domain-containing Ser/Thr kinase [Bacillota bacterium]